MSSLTYDKHKFLSSVIVLIVIKTRNVKIVQNGQKKSLINIYKFFLLINFMSNVVEFP